MNTFTDAIVRTSRSIRRAATNLITRFTRKASINRAITISLPAFVKLAIDCKADLSKRENRLPKPANVSVRRQHLDLIGTTLSETGISLLWLYKSLASAVPSP